MKKLFALFAILLVFLSTATIISPVKAVSSTAIEFTQPTYAYRGNTRPIEVKVSNTGTEVINNLWLGVDLVHKITFDGQTDQEPVVAIPGIWDNTLYTFQVNERIEMISAKIRAKLVRNLGTGEGQIRVGVFWTPLLGLETQVGSAVIYSQDETDYVNKDLLLDEVQTLSSGTLSVKVAYDSSPVIPGVHLAADWVVFSAEGTVEATKTPIKPPGASNYGGIDFGSMQGLALSPGQTRTFSDSYTFTRSQAYSFDYAWGAYYWKLAVWKDGYPGQAGATRMTVEEKSFAIPYKFDLTVSIQWNIDPLDTSATGRGPEFVMQFMKGLRLASRYLFDVADGQMCFGKFTIYDNSEHWNDDDNIRILDDITTWPQMVTEGIWPALSHHVEMGRQWRDPTITPPLDIKFSRWDTNPGGGTYPDLTTTAARTFVHEFGHLMMGLGDEYCSDPATYRETHIPDAECTMEAGDHAACLMEERDGTKSELCNPINHDPDHDTYQTIANDESCWSTVHRKYSWIYIPLVVDKGPHENIGNDALFSLGGRSGDPDNFGYTYLDSNSLIGPAYNWIEISGTGTEVLPSSDDQWVGNIGLGFFFNYYGTDYSQLAIGNNGLLFSGVGTSQYVNQPITQTPSIHGLIAPFWDDIVTWDSAGAIYYETRGTSPNRQFIVEWYDNQHYHSSTSGITFEAILYEGTNNILFQYKDVSFGGVYGSTASDRPPYDNGGSATVGIEDATGNIGLQYSFNQQVIAPGLAISFKFPAFAGTNMYLSMNAPASMDHGNTMIYSLYFNDFGDVAASNVVLQATLSPNVDFVSASDVSTYDTATRRVTWNIGTVPAFPSGRGSRTITVTIPASVPVGTVVQTTASISTSNPQPETRYDDNAASARTTVTGSSLPPNVGIGPTLGNSGGTPSLYWTTPITFTYTDPQATAIDIRIHFDSGGTDITGSMTGGLPLWSFTTTFYPRSGHATATYTVHYPAGDSQVNFGIYVDPAGYIYDAVTLARISGATVWLQRPDGEGGWENVPTGEMPPIMQPDVNPQITGADGQYQWDVLEGSYRVHVEAPGYYPADSIVVIVPPPVTDLHIGLTPLPPPPDPTPPTTNLSIGDPKYTDASDKVYVTPFTPFSLTAEDNPGGSGVASTFYRIHNSTYDSGWLTCTTQFDLTGYSNGNYTITYYSIDNAENAETPHETTVTLCRSYDNPGDVTGDGHVDIFDLVMICAAYDSVPGDPNWNPIADFCPQFGLIDIFDVCTCAQYYEP
jgi:uncharacterized repeat protein (TIGR01451 family)